MPTDPTVHVYSRLAGPYGPQFLVVVHREGHGHPTRVIGTGDDEGSARELRRELAADPDAALELWESS